MGRTLRWVLVLSIFFVPLCGNATTPNQPTKQTKKTFAVLLPQLGLPEPNSLPIGGGMGLQWMLSPVTRFSFGVEASWSRYGTSDFFRAAFVLQVLIDDLIIHPFLQTGVGFQVRVENGTFFLTPDLHLALGFDIPLPHISWLAIGMEFRMFIPIETEHFPVTKSLHLRLKFVF